MKRFAHGIAAIAGMYICGALALPPTLTDSTTPSAGPYVVGGDTTAQASLCVHDGNGNGISNVMLSYTSSIDYGSPSFDHYVKVNNVQGGGYVGMTGSTGCLLLTVLSYGLPPTHSPYAPYLTFFATNLSGLNTVQYNLEVGDFVTQASPTTITGDGTHNITITLPYNGEYVGSIPLVGSCTATGNTTATLLGPGPETSTQDIGPGTSSASGTFILSVTNTVYADPTNTTPPGATCKFSALYAGSTTIEQVTVQAVNICNLPLSPEDTRCAP